MTPQPRSPDPSPHDIVEACRRIRLGWSEHEHRRRAQACVRGRHNVPREALAQRWQIPTIELTSGPAIAMGNR
jgi:hypothetical protein